MMIWNQLQLVLWIIVTINTILLFLLILNIRSKSMVDTKVSLANAIAKISVFSTEGKSKKIVEIASQNNSTLFCFTALSCHYCKEVIPELDKLAETNQMTIVLLNAGDQSEAKQLISLTNTNLIVYSIQYKDLSTKLKLRSFPSGIIINKEGDILKTGIIHKENLSPWTYEQIKNVS